MSTPSSLCYLWSYQSLTITRDLPCLNLNHGADMLLVGLEADLKIRIKGGDTHQSRVVLLPRGTAVNVECGQQWLAILTLDAFGDCREQITQQHRFRSVSGIGIDFDASADLVDRFQAILRDKPDLYACQTQLLPWMIQSGRFQARLDRRIRQVMEQVMQDPTDSVSNKDIAASLKVSEHHFMRLFKKEVGISLSKFRQVCRINYFIASYAKFGNLTDAAHEAGFFDLPHFSNTYKRMLGHTPSRFFHAASTIHTLAA